MGGSAPDGTPASGGATSGRTQRTAPQKRVITVYLGTSALYILAASTIWSINTLFLLHAGLTFFQTMLVNTTFTAGQIIFEVPTGVVADTIGRKAALLLGVGTILVSTLLYVGAARFGWGLPVFIGASIFLGLGFTFQVGTVDAWLYDALTFVEWEGPRERIFAWGGICSSVAGAVGIAIGGFLGNIDLDLPYVARAVLLGFAFLAIALFLKDIGFKPRALKASRFVEEGRKVFSEGLRNGWRNPVVRPMFWISGLQGLFWIFAFYGSQPYFLQLLGRNVVWVAAAVGEGVFLAGILGYSLSGRIMQGKNGRRRPGRVLAVITGAEGLLVVSIGVVGIVALPGHTGLVVWGIAVTIWLLGSVLNSIGMPIRQVFMNSQIPSEQRATVLSVDALFGDVGGTVGQPGLGYLGQAEGIGFAWTLGALAVLLSTPLYLRADRQARAVADAQPSDAAGDRPVA
jgi:MFS family permease